MKYRLRPEWAPQRGVFIVWPHADSDWHDSLAQIQGWYAQFIALVSPTEEIFVLCNNQQTEQDCRNILDSLDIHAPQLHTLQIANNDTWIRDFGPLSLSALDGSPEPEIRWADFRFNAWGGKYDYSLDSQATQRLSQCAFAQATQRYDWILEGGSIDINDDGVILTTANCVLNRNRNPFDQAQLEQRFREDLGAEEVLILDAGFLLGDDTDSHVDNLVRFSDNDTILFCSCDNDQDEHFQSLQAMRQQLESWNRSRPKPYRLIPIPLPEPVYSADGDRLPASYLNFLILNHVVVVPSYHDNEVEKAMLQLFESLFPYRSIVAIPSQELVAQGGGPHCASMQFA